MILQTKRLSVLLCTFGCMGCSRDQQPPGPATQPTILLYAWRYPGYPTPGQNVANANLFVLRTDGLLQRLQDPSQIKGGYVEGTLSQPDLARVHELLEEIRREKLKGTYNRLTVDATSERLVVNDVPQWQVWESLPHRDSGLGNLIRYLFAADLQNPIAIKRPTTVPR